jgi:hypothetical protein
MAAFGAQLTLSESRLSDGFAPIAVVPESIECRGTVRQDGWQTFKTVATELPPDSGVPFELTVTYTATQELSPA